MAGDWYDFGNGKINLKNVTFIIPKISLSYHPVLSVIAKQKIKQLGPAYMAKLENEGGIIELFKQLNNPSDLKTLTDESCVAAGFGTWTNPMSEKDIEAVVGSLNPTLLQCYEDVQVSAYIMFDDFKLELYSFSKEKITKGDLKDIEKGLEKALKSYKKID